MSSWPTCWPGWDGELTGAARKQVRRHISTCALCGEHGRRQVNAVAMLGALTPAVLPASLRYQVLGLLSDASSEAVNYCAGVAQRAGPFTRSGFPAPLDPVASARGPATFIPAAGVLVAVFAVFGGGAMLAANIMHHPAPPVTSVLAPAQPSAQAAPAVHTPSPAASRGAHKKKAGRAGAGTNPGTVGYTYPGTSVPATSTKAATHSASPTVSKSHHTTPPTSSPPSSPTPNPTTSSPTTPPTPTPTPSTGSSAGLLSGILGVIGSL